jgi:cobalt-zinc-cadmium efflux system outer membrane protein
LATDEGIGVHPVLNSTAARLRRSAPARLRGAVFGCCSLLAASPAWADPLTFEQALTQASSEAPSLRADALGVEAARASAVAAGRLPDPRLSFGLDGFPVSGPSAGRFDDIMMTTFKVGLQQDVPSGARRGAERDIAEAEIDVARARAATTLWEVRIAAGRAWIDLHYAERRLAVLDELLVSLEPLWEAAPSGVASSRLRPAQALGPVELKADLEDRRDRLRADLAAARAQLSRWTGDPAPRADGPAPAIDLDPDARTVRLADLPPLRAYRAAARRAEADIDLARAGRQPDWSFEVGYAHRDAAFGDLVSVGASVRLPLFQASRQEPLIAARSADALRVSAERESVERAWSAELEGDLAQYASARTRWIRATEVVLPNLRDRADLETASYGAGAAGLADVLDAFTSLANARLDALDREAEVARLAVQITLTYGSGQ